MRMLTYLLIPFIGIIPCFLAAQNLQVETILDLDASGGVTFGPDGNVYVSDFGPALGTASVNTKVYKVEYGTWEVSEFASGFMGASGSRFDSQGNFYQSNPSGGRVSKRSTSGTINYFWSTTGMSAPIGLVDDGNDTLYVCNCGNNTVRKIAPSGSSTLFATSPFFNCPNGITRDPAGNLYACNFNDGRIIKMTPQGNASLFITLPVNGGVGNGHLTYSNGYLFVATIGTGQIFKISLNGQSEHIAGVPFGFSNNDGPALQATFSKPNGIAASFTGDTLWVNVSVPTWVSNPNALHPGKVRMITGVCSLPDVDCPLLTSTKEQRNLHENSLARLLPLSPNPAGAATTLRYEIRSAAQDIRISVMDVAGHRLYSLNEDRKQPGVHTLDLDLTDYAPGLYTIQLATEHGTLIRKLIVVE